MGSSECEQEGEDYGSELSDRRYNVTWSRWRSIVQKSVDPIHLRVMGCNCQGYSPEISFFSCGRHCR